MHSVKYFKLEEEMFKVGPTFAHGGTKTHACKDGAQTFENIFKIKSEKNMNEGQVIIPGYMYSNCSEN